ncbi:MAG: hypothetical protein Q9O74_08610 [Planctomycetota bacterium]|nr:hypothetical protein [Planctomycetota bacterium]
MRIVAALGLVAQLTGCGGSGYQADARLLGLVARAEFGRAREVLALQTPDADRHNDLLYATKRGMMALAEGLPDAADRDFEIVFETLRTQGLNADRTTESIFVNEEGVRIWKGEPFEQAMAYAAIALTDASRGDWGNARASAVNALFHLREYDETGSDTGDFGYRPVVSDFALGYLLKGIAALEMFRREEAEEELANAVASDAALAPVRDVLLAGNYDTILVIDYGFAPRREAVGAGGVAVRYFPRTRSDNAAVAVSFAGTTRRFPQACDVNTMAHDARWQSRESIRRFKQGLGEAMVLGGLVLASTGGTDGDDDIARLAAGAGLMLLGAIAQSNSRADTRHNELLPQRVYVVPLMLDGYSGPVRVQVDNRADSLMTLHGLHLRDPGETVLRYVRLPSARVEWAAADRVLYANDATGALPEPTLPWILGGRDARFPTQEVVHDAERAGLEVFSTTDPITDTLGEIRELYRAEGIRLFPPGDTRLVTGHLFEGGHSLFTPLPGTTGFTRLFARQHTPYQPKTNQLRNFLAQHMHNTPAAETLREEVTP